MTFSETFCNPGQNSSAKQSQIKNLILTAWRERWTDVQWGIHAKTILRNGDLEDDTFLAESILQQALNGPGPNSMVLTYLIHSLFSQVISAASLLRSVSRYEGYHKPFCIMSLLNLLDRVKDRLIIDDLREDKCLELSTSLASILHWLLTCMYYSLENLSDLSEISSETEHAKIVRNCKALVQYFMQDPYLKSLVHVSILEDSELFGNIQRMSKEIEKFQEGHHKEDIVVVNSLISQLGTANIEEISLDGGYSCKSIDERKLLVVNACIHSTLMTAAILKLATDISKVANEVLVIKQLQNISNIDLYCDIVHSALIGLVDSLGKEHELKLIGFTFLQLPNLLSSVQGNLKGSKSDFVNGLELFIANESTLEIIDSKLHCSSLDLLLTSLQKNNLLTESQKTALLNRKSSAHVQLKPNSSSIVFLLKAEATLLSVLKTLDGDFAKNQDAILSVLFDMLGKSFDLILTAASKTGKLNQVTLKLVKLNQCSRQVIGEAGKASTTRAMIFDISFLMLCNIVQQYGRDAISVGESDCFIEDWCRECMVEENTAKNPTNILARCDQGKVDSLLSQYLQGEELKTSLVFWHEVCTNSVGVIHDLLLAWENDRLTFDEIKKVVDTFRSRMCCLPVCISSWLCAYIQVMPDERCNKARMILNHLLSPVKSDEIQDKLVERHAMMSIVINKMLCSIRPNSISSSTPDKCSSRNKPNTNLFSHCWSRMLNRGLVDVETTANLKHLLEINGASHFVTVCIQQIFDLQHTAELTQWRDMLYGVFHIDLIKCTEALLTSVLPACLHLSIRDPNIVEPQITALVSLTVDIIISCYESLKSRVKTDDITDDEPQKKRRRLSASSTEDKERTRMGTKYFKLETALKEMYNEFSKALSWKNNIGPQVLFISKFLEEFTLKTTSPDMIHFLPFEIVDRLISMNGKLCPKLLLKITDLSSHTGRKKCSKFICALKQCKK